MSLLIKVDRRSSIPAFRQVTDQVVRLIREGTLLPGDRLPATRAMAHRLGLNRSTVYRAYEELWSAGYIESRPGSYSTVRQRTELAARPPGPDQVLIPWAGRAAPGCGEVWRAAQKEAALLGNADQAGAINFIPLSPDSRLFPLDRFRKCLNTVLAEQGESLLQYGPPLGHAPLRETVARRMNLHSVSLSAREIMITAGAQNAMELILRFLVGPGSTVVMEAPSYPRMLDALRLSRARIVGVPMTPEGMDLSALETILRSESPALVYTMTNFHNPSGVTTGQVHRERLLDLCRNYRTPLVEDGFEEEMKYFGKAVPPLKSMDRNGVVIYLGTFSKVLFPGLRIGWIAADQELIRLLGPIQRTLLLSANQADQAALDLFIRQGFYDLHLRKMHGVYRLRMKAALAALKTHLDPDLAGWIEPNGGYTIWVRVFIPGISEEDLVAAMAERKVRILPGGTHFIDPEKGVYFRLSIAHLDEDEIAEGIRRVGLGLRALSR